MYAADHGARQLGIKVVVIQDDVTCASYVTLADTPTRLNLFFCLPSLVPSYFLSYFTRFSDIHDYTTRQSFRLSLPKVKLNCGRRTFLFSDTKFFNELPLNIAKFNTESIQPLCRRATHFFLS